MAENGGIILGLGNPLLDISCTTTMEFIQKYKLKPIDAILATDIHIPLFQEIVENFDVKYLAGGAAQNSIRVAQWMLSQTSPRSTGFIGAVGDDSNARILENCCENMDGITTCYMKNSDKVATGTCAALINPEGRSLVANLAAANTFSVSHLMKPRAKELIQSAMIFYIEGFFLPVSMASILHVAQHANHHNKIFAVSFASTSCWSK